MRPAGEWQLPALPVLTYYKYAPFRPSPAEALQMSPLYEGYGRHRPVLGIRQSQLGLIRISTCLRPSSATPKRAQPSRQSFLNLTQTDRSNSLGVPLSDR
ncbi:hypothetical protein EN827_17170 [Mesorhizobium sp. M1D.F.Ca.ET.184.01.1.1]|nr:hypothetical protein EN874_017170 [Mesorhizobium sp. M1D.F.Ca.ET.231.01.1.1]TGP32365.1 hypothetical protein EN877_17175 [Mesorhizobium sp. M1D.F.Ca.ET.234.01.1.1]TGS46829.1 hypothetical protein EN827_17170 [Mesorhizobium sp. M1D.F.Ca.ET.184.01.1.1]TGS61655.1 hypothetical protein EN826_017170 [Mesorhizobium sp. M1D.F.Ca.ET.183.01.1.1]